MNTNSLNNSYRFLGYIAVWPALYAVGVVTLTWYMFAGSIPDMESIIYILLCAHSCYLLDRVKVSDRRLDPADSLSLPRRAQFYEKWALQIRGFILLSLIVASILGYMLHPLLAVIPIVALVVVHIYAGRAATPGSPRLKDWTGIKSFIIASGHVALALAIVFASGLTPINQLGAAQSGMIIGVWLIVSGDAALCDIDDHDSDLAFQTRSLSVIFGKNIAWRTSFLLITAGSLILLFALPNGPTLSIIGISSTLIVTTLITKSNTNHRDFIDARLLPIVILWISIG